MQTEIYGAGSVPVLVMSIGLASGGRDCEIEREMDLSPTLSSRSAAAHKRIVDAARELFCRHGIHATGIDRILSAAGASKMALYSRFGSKEALIREVLEQEGADWRAAFFAAVAAGGDTPLARLQAVVPALGQWFEDGRFYGCVFMNAIAEHDKDESWLREIAAAHHEKVLAFLAGMAAEAGFSEPAMLARQVLLLIDGATAALMVTSDEGVLAVAGRNLAAVLGAAAARPT